MVAPQAILLVIEQNKGMPFNILRGPNNYMLVQKRPTRSDRVPGRANSKNTAETGTKI